MPLQIPNAKEKKETVAPATEAKVAATAETAEKKVYGSMRKNLAFVKPLGDPSNADTTTVTAPDGTKTKKVTSTICGYKFKVLADMKVPDCGTNEGFKKDPMNFVEIDNWRDAKEGEIIALTPYETALLLSQESFNGGCEGGEKPVSCVYQIKSVLNKSGESLKNPTQVPRVSLRAATGSIKDFDIEDVLTFTAQQVNGVTRKNRVINKGFEKWIPLCKATTRTAQGSKDKSFDPTSVANKNAQAFLAFVNAKKAK